MNLNRWKNPEALDALAKSLTEAVAVQAVPSIQLPLVNGQATKRGPVYEWRKPWTVKLFGTGCATCGSNGKGWVSRAINMPPNGHWFRRSLALLDWALALVPRVWSLARTVFSRKVDPAEYVTRMKTCYDAPCSIRFLRYKGNEIVEELHCGKCNCPRTRFASLRRKNKKAGWRCPAGLHAGSDRDAAYKEYVQVQQAEVTNGD